jgi:hypothetical protein
MPPARQHDSSAGCDQSRRQLDRVVGVADDQDILLFGGFGEPVNRDPIAGHRSGRRGPARRVASSSHDAPTTEILLLARGDRDLGPDEVDGLDRLAIADIELVLTDQPRERDRRAVGDDPNPPQSRPLGRHGHAHAGSVPPHDDQVVGAGAHVVGAYLRTY